MGRAICAAVAVYLAALASMAVYKSRLAELVVHSPLVFLNLVLAMLLVAAGKQLYQKNF